MSRNVHIARDRLRARTLRRRDLAGVTCGKSLLALGNWFLADGGIFANLKLHGNTKWSPLNLVRLALCWAWSDSRNLTDAFTQAAEFCQTTCGSAALSTYQGFMAALVRWTSPLMEVLWSRLHQKMKEIGGKFWRIADWVPIAFDGSRSTAPRTEANEKAFCASNYGKGKTARYRKKKTKGMRRRANEKNRPQPQEPQAWITMLWHMGLRLPWMWRLGPSNSSERTHVMEMLDAGNFPSKTLFCGDAGFVGYALWSRILLAGGHFLVRVGANVSLLKESTNYQLRKDGIVLCWPRAIKQTEHPPLRLRLVKIRLGKTTAWMLTNVLDPAQLTRNQMTMFYKMRWGVEVEFRGLKQTLDRARLRCRNDQRLLAELNWSIMAMAVAELFAMKEQLSNRGPQAGKASQAADPAKRSLATTMRAIRRCMRQAHRVPSAQEDLQSALRRAVTDSYQRKAGKRARYNPPNPDKKPLGEPRVRTITAAEKRSLSQFAGTMAA
jgi:DDE family transposase